jgi:hypothetical protein
VRHRRSLPNSQQNEMTTDGDEVALAGLALQTSVQKNPFAEGLPSYRRVAPERRNLVSNSMLRCQTGSWTAPAQFVPRDPAISNAGPWLMSSRVGSAFFWIVRNNDVLQPPMQVILRGPESARVKGEPRPRSANFLYRDLGQYRLRLATPRLPGAPCNQTARRRPAKAPPG